MSATVEHRCWHPDDAQHKAHCYCGALATHHVSYGTGCGNVCEKHGKAILGRKRLSGPAHIRAIS